MKIALVNQPWDSVTPPVQSGSIPIWNYQVARQLAQSCQVVVYARQNRKQKAVEWSEQVEYRRVSVIFEKVVNRLSRLINKFSPKSHYFASRLYGVIYALSLALDLRQQQCDVVHIHNFSQFVPLIRAFNPKIKIVLHMHCEWLSQLNPTIIAKRLAHVDLIIGCSHYITDKIKACYPQFAERCQTVFNGVDVEKFLKNSDSESQSDCLKLLFVGRISPEKGLHTLIDAFKIVLKQYPQTQLQIVGPNKPTPTEFIATLSDEPTVASLAKFTPKQYYSYLQSQLSSHIANQVSFVGGIKHSQLVELYQEADLLINPSLSESFGMSLVEAMAMGLPVIASRVGGMTGIVEEGKTGFLFEPDNPIALAEAMMRLIENKQLRTVMGQAGRQRVLNYFSWHKVAESLFIHYSHLIELPEQSLVQNYVIESF
ncbi:glycosyl transferase group 1 [Stanieria sp. NIES-3757]|nr:glycosyl transferase group 1 [Stanieria sp. NIES-3757]